MAKPYFPFGYLKYAHKFLQAGDPQPYYVTGAAVTEENAANVAAVAQGLHTAAQTFHQARMPQNIILKETIVRFSQGPDVEDLTQQHAADMPGGSQSAPLPQNCAFLIQKFTGLAGRHNQGRMYWPCPAEGEVDPTGQILPAVVPDFNNALEAYRQAVRNVVGIGDMVLLHTPRPGVLFPLPTVVTSLILDPVISTQRRRLR